MAREDALKDKIMKLGSKQKLNGVLKYINHPRTVWVISHHSYFIYTNIEIGRCFFWGKQGFLCYRNFFGHFCSPSDCLV